MDGQVPQLQDMVIAFINSLPELMNVIIMLGFIFALSAILGMEFFSGRQHFRCRLTPWPVTMDWGQNISDMMNFDK